MNKLFFCGLVFLALLSCNKQEDPAETTPTTAFTAVGNKVRIDGNLTEAELKALSAVSVGNKHTAFYVGYEQVSSDNQNPVAYRFDNGQLTWRTTNYETTGDDGSAYGILWDGAESLYFVFSATGTQGNAADDYRRFCTEGWLTNYGSGGGPKVAILAKINAQTGTAESGTFLYAQLSNGKTNSLEVTNLAFDAQGNIVVSANSWYSPLKTDKSRFTCQGSSPFEYTVCFKSDLSWAISAQTNGCE